MSIFDLSRDLVKDYAKYVRSFFSFADQRIEKFVTKELAKKGRLWPDPLLQVNPGYEQASDMEELCAQGKLHPLCKDIFYDQKLERPLRLFRHQEQAVENWLQRTPFVVTSGTGSGKTLTYLIPIFDSVLRNNPSEAKVHAIIIYPMNALVNSQYEALKNLARSFKERKHYDMPVRFAKYTGQEKEEFRLKLQQNPPHVLLTNYVMLELMLLRPSERPFVDRTSADLQFVVLDELHTYRGRRGADIALLVRRLRERCGNPKLFCIGTSATMVSGDGMGTQERRAAVADFASRLFGVEFSPENVIEETLRRVTEVRNPTPEALLAAIQRDLPKNAEEMARDPIASWVEETFGVEEESSGYLRRRVPLSIEEGAKRLSELTGLGRKLCKERLVNTLLRATEIKAPDGNPFFAFKLHHFFSQGRTVYATLESQDERVLTLEGQYYAAKGQDKKLFYPLTFCRICGQEYYTVLMDVENGSLLPWDLDSYWLAEGEFVPGYLMISRSDFDWSREQIPDEWIDKKGRVKRGYRQHVPTEIWVRADGTFSEDQAAGALRAWFQPRPFMLCLNCGEFYSLRDKNDFRKLARLSSEGRSTSTTVMITSVLLHAHKGQIAENARKVLSFTDNRQDASLQAGHFNDFVQVSLLRSGLMKALQKNGELRFDNVAERTFEAMGLDLDDYSQEPGLAPDSLSAKRVTETFLELIEYRLYEDLRRGWRIIQPNLEQCGLLRVDYLGLRELCSGDSKWQHEGLEPFQDLSAEERYMVLKTVLDHFRRKLAINVKCLTDEAYQREFRKRVQHLINDRWSFEESERLYIAKKFLLPGKLRSSADGFSLSASSLLGRYLRRTLKHTYDYDVLITAMVNLLRSQGLLVGGTEKGAEYVRLNASCLLWVPGDGVPIYDQIYARRVADAGYAEPTYVPNEFFTEFYRNQASMIKGLEGREHTAQITSDSRLDREERFRNGELSCLFCSPTMELGIDIADLQMVHLRNVPPTPANYAQRSGRAGRRGDPAIILTYCAARSAHDQYFFRNRDRIVSGAVVAPCLDLSNEDLFKAHIHAVWLAKVGCALGSSIADLVELDKPGYPLNMDLKEQIHLSPFRLRDCYNEVKHILESCKPSLLEGGWYSDEWLWNVLRSAADEFDRAFEHWREMYKAAEEQWDEANQILRYPSKDKQREQEAERRRMEAQRQKRLLCNRATGREESDFYPYRYLASEGFLPGYNFPRLPLRAYIPRGEGEFIARPRFLALSEFGPYNIVYHEGAKYQVRWFMSPLGDLAERQRRSKICRICGYFNEDVHTDLCENCNTQLDASNSEIVSLLEMSSVKTRRTNRITCDEEERRRSGYEITTHFKFAAVPGMRKKVTEADVVDSTGAKLIRLVYAPTATLYRLNHGWRNKRERGFLIDLRSGEILDRSEKQEKEKLPGENAPSEPVNVRLFTQDTFNILLLYAPELAKRGDATLATLEYALKRGIETAFQVEESELASELIGSGEHRTILFWEAAEGGIGVLRRLVQESKAISKVARTALERCHFDPSTLEDLNPECVSACYECLLSYTNQREHAMLDRHAIKDYLKLLTESRTLQKTQGRSYEEHYAELRSKTDPRSELEREFLDYLHATGRRLPDSAQEPLADFYCVPDFFYQPNVCIFCDGSVHDKVTVKDEDSGLRQELKERGYRVIVIRYDVDLEEQIRKHQDVFGQGKVEKV